MTYDTLTDRDEATAIVAREIAKSIAQLDALSPEIRAVSGKLRRTMRAWLLIREAWDEYRKEPSWTENA